ncbi:MAG TPA: protein kinase [Kofleriaceae bacterium]
MVDRDGGSGPRTELDLTAAAAAAVEAARDDGAADAPPLPPIDEPLPPAPSGFDPARQHASAAGSIDPARQHASAAGSIDATLAPLPVTAPGSIDATRPATAAPAIPPHVHPAGSGALDPQAHARGTREEVELPRQARGTRDDVPPPSNTMFGGAAAADSARKFVDFERDATAEARRPDPAIGFEATAERGPTSQGDLERRVGEARRDSHESFRRGATAEARRPDPALGFEATAERGPTPHGDFAREATAEAPRRDARIAFDHDVTSVREPTPRGDFAREATAEAPPRDARIAFDHDVTSVREPAPHVDFERDATAEARRPDARVSFERDGTGEPRRRDTHTSFELDATSERRADIHASFDLDPSHDERGPEPHVDFERDATAEVSRRDFLPAERPVRQVVDFERDATSEHAAPFVLREKATELDLRIAAAAAVAAVEAARRDLDSAKREALETEAAHSEHQTQVGTPSAIGTPPPRKVRPNAFAPTAALAELTADTPAGELEPLEELPEGTLLAGRYHVTELVGQGGMGAVYAAHDDDLDEDIALKVLRPDLGRDSDFQRRLKAEVRLARRVSHPNVCRVHDIGVDDEIVFVTMELVRGSTLRERLAETISGRSEPLELAQIVDIIVQIGSALSAAHRAGVIHRDVKPDNVILSGGRAVLTDFGVASMVVDRKHAIVGTPAYLAPEVLRQEPFDHRVDVYAVACLAYELIAGAPPFAARTLEAAINLARDRPSYPGLPDTFATPAVRASLDRVLFRGLASDPHLRPPTMERFTDAFAHAARGAPLSLAVPGRRQERLSTQDSATPAPLVRRTELRVTTAFVWYANRGPRDTEQAERIVVDAGGTPIRVVPGEIVALFGATRSGGDDADRAAHAALAVVAKYGGRVGLDTTRILLRPNDNDLAGPDSAATAATLAHDSREGQIWASKATARQLAARFKIEVMLGDARRVVGTRETVDEIAIESIRPAELAAIDEHLERAFRERTPVFVEVRGGPGSGKTRLRKAVMGAVNARRDVEWLVAVTSPIGEPAPLSIVQSCSAEWFDATTAGEPTQRNLKAKRWLETRATHRPVVVVAEDLQWADPTSRALLDYLRENLERVPVAVLTFARAEQTEPVTAGVELVTLAPLDVEQATRVARTIAPNADDAAIAAIVERAAGNPFFIEELAREAATGSSALPTSIEAVVQGHLDQLPAIANQVASAAAVIGHGFWRGAIARLIPALSETELDSALAELERAGVIVPATRVVVADDYYQFTSTLVRDVAYARVPARERRGQHGVVAGWLDEQTRNTEQDAPRLLAVAHHREHAGDSARAALAYRQAGKRCLDLFAYGEATTALRKAAALITVPDPVLDEALGDALTNTDGYAAAEASYQRALDETDDDDHPTRARLLYKLGGAASKRGNTANAIARYKAGLAIAAPGNNLASWAVADPRTPALLWAGLGWTIGYQLGNVDEGHPYCERAVAVLETTPHRRDLAHALSRLGGTYMRACRFADQLRCNQRNLEIAVELGDLNMQLTANINLGVVYGVLGILPQAVNATLAARKLASRMSAAASDGLAASNLAGYYLELGRLDDADALLDEAIVTLERTGSRYVLPESFAFRARIAAARGNLTVAREFAEKSFALARTLGNQLDVAIAQRLLASLDSRAGDHDAARKRIEEALVAATVHDELEAIKTRAARARILAAAHDSSAESELADLEHELRRLGTKRELAVLRDLTQVR